MQKTEQWPLEKFEPDPQELARHDDPEEIRLRGLDMQERGQLQPVAATEDGRMIYGHGRYLAALSAGIKTLEVKVFPALDETQFILTRAAENLQRKELTGYRKWRLCDALIELNGWDQKTLAQHLHLGESNVTRLLSPSKSSAAWQEALREGKVTISDCYAASKLPLEDQAGLLALKLSGASRDTLEQVGRKKRANVSGKPAVCLSRVDIAMPRDVNVVIRGNDLSMAEVVEVLTETLKEARKAADIYDVKTFQNMMRDRAKAG